MHQDNKSRVFNNDIDLKKRFPYLLSCAHYRHINIDLHIYHFTTKWRKRAMSINLLQFVCGFFSHSCEGLTVIYLLRDNVLRDKSVIQFQITILIIVFNAKYVQKLHIFLLVESTFFHLLETTKTKHIIYTWSETV